MLQGDERFRKAADQGVHAIFQIEIVARLAAAAGQHQLTHMTYIAAGAESSFALAEQHHRRDAAILGELGQ